MQVDHAWSRIELSKTPSPNPETTPSVNQTPPPDNLTHDKQMFPPVNIKITAPCDHNPGVLCVYL